MMLVTCYGHSLCDMLYIYHLINLIHLFLQPIFTDQSYALAIRKAQGCTHKYNRYVPPLREVSSINSYFKLEETKAQKII